MWGDKQQRRRPSMKLQDGGCNDSYSDRCGQWMTAFTNRGRWTANRRGRYRREKKESTELARRLLRIVRRNVRPAALGRSLVHRAASRCIAVLRGAARCCAVQPCFPSKRTCSTVQSTSICALFQHLFKLTEIGGSASLFKHGFALRKKEKKRKETGAKKQQQTKRGCMCFLKRTTVKPKRKPKAKLKAKA